MIGKRLFDLFLAIFLFSVFLPLLVLLVVCASLDTAKFGIFIQQRIGQWGKPFQMFKIRSIQNNSNSTVTTFRVHQISAFGRFIRKYHLDELPQLLNIILGDMSFVGPRPDVPGFADMLEGDQKIMLQVKPGLTGPAQLHFWNEPELIANQPNPEIYSSEMLWPKKVEINAEYARNRSFMRDLYYIAATVKKLLQI